MKKFQSFKQLSYRDSFAELGSKFSVAVSPIPIREPELVCCNAKVAAMLNIEPVDSTEVANIFSGNEIPKQWQPVAHRYAGHQYGKFNHFLGDGRCVHLTELDTDQGVMNVSLKGSGKTPFANDGDGRTNLATGIKEFLVTAALDALGTPTSQNLFLVRGKNPISRKGDIQPAAVITRVAPNFIRFGHFENFYYSGDTKAVKTLADFCLDHYFQSCLNADDPYQAMLKEVVINTAKLTAHWQSIGFIHGSMNTDNQSICGLTLDHGTCTFMDTYEPDVISCSNDTKALFTFDQQPSAGVWNCGIFAQTLSSLLSKDKIAESLAEYSEAFEATYMSLMREKLGLEGEHDGDILLIQDLLALLEKHRLAYTPSLRRLSSISLSPISARPAPSSQADASNEAANAALSMALQDLNWLDRYCLRADPEIARRQSRMNSVNPATVLSSTDIDSVVQAALLDNYAPLNALLQLVTNPF